jgi:hypothetical protein
MSTAKCFSVWQDELNSCGEVSPGDLWEAIAYFLIGHVQNPIREVLSIFNPGPTK